MSEIKKWITEEEYKEEAGNLDKILRDFCQASKIYDYDRVSVNLQSVEDMIVRVYKRKKYFEIFHDEMITSEYKDTALFCYWVLKLRPFWIDPSVKGADRINEKFALHMYLSLLKRYNENFDEEDGISVRHLEELLYSFRYRDLTKEALILMLEPYYYECLRKEDCNF